MADPAAAADELSRVVRDHGFVGANINGHCQGRRLDDEYLWPILERAEALAVPLYLHPTPPPKTTAELLYAGNYPAAVADVLASFAWGRHIETAIHLLRVILNGAFDRFPKLQFVIGHMGEVLPCMLPRLDQTLPTGLTNLRWAPSEYLRRNVHYTTVLYMSMPFHMPMIRLGRADAMSHDVVSRALRGSKPYDEKLFRVAPIAVEPGQVTVSHRGDGGRQRS